MSITLLSILFALSFVTFASAVEKGSTKLVEGVKFDAEFYSPQGEAKKLAVLVLGGSEGGIPSRQAQILTREGFPALALGYFKTAHTPEYLDMIPLEYFDEAIKWLETNPDIKGRKLVVVGTSKGGELALLLASRNPRIRGVVAFVPASVVFQGIPKEFWPSRSSWSYKGEPVPFVPYSFGQGSGQQNPIEIYQQSLKQEDAVKQAGIPVERINGHVLLFSAASDAMWPSTEMCEMIVQRLKKMDFNYKYEHIKYENAGHTLTEHFIMGGTAEGNKKARIDSTRRMLEFLNEISD